MGTSYIVRYGATRNIAEFSVRASDTYQRSSEVIVRSDRGVEWGEVLCESSEKTRKHLKSRSGKGRILRGVNESDRQTGEGLVQQELEEYEGARTMIEEHKLQMQLVDVEHLFGGERIVFYYLAEKRVDFRELVKALAKRFRARIEMRQIGVRDEAKLLADYGDCGKPVCCNTHLTEMPPVSMKMAKMQKATLDPNKISGRCGRLKCCLRYEFETYEQHRKELPKVGVTVVTKAGQGKVVGIEILAKKVLVNYETGQRILTDVDALVPAVRGGPPPGEQGRLSKPQSPPPAAESKQQS